MPRHRHHIPLALVATLALTAAVRAGDGAGAAFEALCLQIQQSGAGASEKDIQTVFTQARSLGRPYTAHLAVKPYFEQNLTPGQSLLLSAAENATLAADYRTAVGRYKSYLKNAASNPESSKAAAQMYTIQIDLIGTADDAYLFMKQVGSKYREDVLARKFDAWLIDEARNRKDYAAVAERLGIVFADKMPLEQERLYYWQHLEWLLDETGKANPEHFPAAAALRALAPLVRDTPVIAAKTAFYGANLAYFAGGFHNNKERAAPEFESVVATAKAYMDAAPRADIWQDVFSIFVGGSNRFEDGCWNVQKEKRMAVLQAGFEKLQDADKKTILNWNHHNRFIVRYLAHADKWIEWINKQPDLFTASIRAQLPMAEGHEDPAFLRKQAAVLQNVPSKAAAVSNAFAASEDLKDIIRNLTQKQSWHLSANDMNELIRGRVWQTFKSGKKVNDDALNDALLECGVETFLQTPAAMFDPNAAREIVWHMWNAKDSRAKFPVILHSLDWIPFTEQERKHIFGQSYDQFKNWADGVRKGKQDDPKIKAAVEQLTALDKAFNEVLDPKIFDATKVKDPLLQKLALTVHASRTNNRDLFVQNAREAYKLCRDYEKTQVPFGQHILRSICTSQTFDTSDFQLEAVTDQLATLDINGSFRQIADVFDGIGQNRKDWHRHAWNWWNTPKRDVELVKKINAAVTDTLTKLVDKDQFSPNLFSIYRWTRRGHDYQDHNLNNDLFAKIIEKKLFTKTPYLPEWWVRSNAGSYQWLGHREFQGLQGKYSHERFFDDPFAAEMTEKKYLDPSYWQFGRDESRKIANAAAPLLAEWDKLPYGYDANQRGYERNDIWDWHRRATGADAKIRDAYLDKVESTYGKTRFDGYAMGAAYFTSRAQLGKPEERKQFFTKMKEYADRATTHPARVGPPYLEALDKLKDAKSLSDDEINALLAVFPGCVPGRWSQGNRHEALAETLHASLVARNRSNELFPLVPYFWKMARDMNNPGFQRTLSQFAKTLTDDGKHELATVYISAGLDVVGGAMAEDVQSALRAARAKSMLNVGSVNPFKRSDPRFNIGNAQAEFLSGKLQTAWDIYTNHRNLVRDNFKELDPGFVLWLIDKNTETRLFEEAELLSRSMMQYFEATPGGFEPETRARLFLNYANVAFERQEYPRARAHFERIAEAKEYEGTRARREAELKIAEVDRRTKNYDRAIAQLEKLTKKKDDFQQLEALYQLALVKYDQEDFAEASRYLEEVFNRNRNHAAAKILEGKLALQTKRYEKALDLAMGQATTQEILVPGRPLKVTLEDKNLSVVGQAVQIEIRAWTDSGDEETFTLLPAGDSKTTFEGRLPSALGKIEKGDKTLQVFGKDKIHYDFSENFKKNHKITDANPGTLIVASNAELQVSSGRILSKEEMEERALERMVRERLRAETGAEVNQEALSKLRKDDQIKPGNAINVRVVDTDRNMTPEVDKIQIGVRASSGDRIPNFVLTETGPTTGVFEGSVPTASAQAMAFASDSEEGRDPNFVITAGEKPYWSALPDSIKPKFFTIDLNDNLALGKMHLDSGIAGRKLKSFVLQSSLNGRDFQTIGQYPGELSAWDGSLKATVTRWPHGDNGPGTLDKFQQYLEFGWMKDKQPRTELDPGLMVNLDHDLNGKNQKLNMEWDGPRSHYIVHIRGAFYLSERQTRTFKVETGGGDKNRYKVLLAINGQIGAKPDEVERSFIKGVHRVDLYVFASRHARPAVKLLCDTTEPPYMAPCPPEMFDVAKHPEIKQALFFETSKVAEAAGGAGFDVAFGKDAQARSLRIAITDYETDAPAIQKITLAGADGKPVLPTKEDFASLRQNQMLEIVPGDRVAIVYDDKVIVTKGKEHHEAFLTATFHNADMSACFVEYLKNGERRIPEYIPMRRFKAGDKINVFINDPDMDVTENEDVVTFTARTPNGQAVKFKALETEKHSGIFIGNIFPVPGKPERDVEMTVTAGDDVLITYRDQENTEPGVPWDRTYVVEQAIDKTPDLRLFDVKSVALKPEDQEAWLKQRKQDSLGVEELIPAERDLLAALQEGDAKGETEIKASGPLLVELRYPALAQSARSAATIYVQTASARKKAGKDKPDEFDIQTPGTLKLTRTPKHATTPPVPAGYRELLVRGGREAADALESGRFTFHIPMKFGTIPEKTLVEEENAETQARNINNEETPPLTIWGSDEVFIGFQFGKDNDKKWVVRKAVLTSDVMFHIMDRRYQEQRSGAYVGETIYFRVIFPSADVSDDKDSVELALNSSSGKQAKVKLNETTSHSGIFKGFVRLVYSGEKQDAVDNETFAVNYGDLLSATFTHARLPEPAKRELQVYKGADGHVLALTKRFKDPTIAVQTQLTLAEAYFEQAKRHRDLGQRELSAKEIAQGKNILEEAQRDYPNAEARAQVDYLLANLALEFAGDAPDQETARKFYVEAITRFSDFVRNYPDTAYAPKAQYKKALTLEKMNQMDEACEEYVKLSYRYPENELVAETIARLGQYFWNKGKALLKEADAKPDLVEAEKIRLKARDMYKTAGQVFGRLAARFPQHNLAGKTRVLSAQCFIQAGDLNKATEIFSSAVKDPNLSKELIAESMYWCADCYNKQKDHLNAYRMFVKLTWDYPASVWAKHARARLTEDQFAKMDVQQVEQ